MNKELETVIGHNMNRWSRRLIKIKGSFYVNIPKSIVSAYAKKEGSVVFFNRIFDERAKRILIVLEL